MADYGAQQGRNFRPNDYGHSSNFQRDAAYAEIFGGAPPPGRSQTMTSQSAQPQQDRAYTMSSHVPDPAMQRGPPPIRQNGYNPGMGNGYSPNNYQQPPRPGTSSMSSQPHPQNLPRPFPERSAYPQPQRLDARTASLQQYPNKMGPGRPGPPPALNNDPYRSRSMARAGPMPPYQQQPPNSFNHTSANAFRQQPYNPAMRMTAQGRAIPERQDNERAMSMSSYMPGQESYAHTINSGRVVPNRRWDDQQQSGGHVSPEIAYSQQQARVPSQAQVDRERRPSEASTMTPSRTMSMASTIQPDYDDRTNSIMSTTSTVSHRPSISQKGSSQTQQGHTSRRAPLVYPALLSRVAEVFRERIHLGDRMKNDLSYTNAFTGSEAVDLISYIIKTTDRNLALLLGRALDAQKFFHDVTYDHRLRDAPGEVYKFKETMGEDVPASADVNGVFTLLTECYSPTCTRDHLCYSIACPRRLEQQARLNLKPEPGLKSSTSKGSLHGDDNEDQKLWMNTVSKEIADSIDDKEKKRQEIIFEIMYTERDFVKDLEYLRDFWMRPLRNIVPNQPSPIPEHRREKFIRLVFSNVTEVLAVNKSFSEALNCRQKENSIVKNVGDVFLQYVPRFDPFIKYGANQLYGKYEFEKERGSNPAFAKFVDETERLKESRKLELNGYLTKPTTRLARYPLLLEGVLKATKDGNPDKEDIPKAIAIIKDFLSRVNTESGKAENHFNLMQLNLSLKFTPGDYVDLKLTEENRQMLVKMGFKKAPGDNAEITAYLFDHAVLLVRIKMVNKREEYKVYRKPIPLELLVILQMDEVLPKLGIAKRPSTNLIPGNRAASNASDKKDGFPITFKHLGKGGYDITVYATSHSQRKKFIEKVEEQQTKLKDRNSNFYQKNIISENFFNSANRVNCLVPTGETPTDTDKQFS